MADWGGFEPPTPWFVAKYSIQLSYQSMTAGIIPRRLTMQGPFSYALSSAMH